VQHEVIGGNFVATGVLLLRAGDTIAGLTSSGGGDDRLRAHPFFVIDELTTEAYDFGGQRSNDRLVNRAATNGLTQIGFSLARAASNVLSVSLHPRGA